MNTFNQVCNQISEVAYHEQEFQKIQLHHLVYKAQREALPEFSSQLVIRAIDRVSCSYKTKRGRVPNGFKRTASVAYDARCISFRGVEEVSIWTHEGRLKIPIQVWDEQKFVFQKGQVDLILQNGIFFLLCVIDIPDVKKRPSKGVIGVDLGVKNIATTSEGDIFSSVQLEKKRKQYHDHRQRLQKRGTRSAKRRIKIVGNKESRFRKDVNHVISKIIVSKAKGTQKGIALEDLTHINKRATVRKAYRNERMSWSFYQLRNYITYKAEQHGVPLFIVPAPYTSQTCSECGHCEKANRRSQELFLCCSCGHTENADFNASKNISRLGEQSTSLLLAPPGACSKPTR